ncbi:MAG: hypothetical protein KGL39_03470 [Patescibacteria group bacterium]|nr:hypothetical protein [Patescibacteria group bacterium]
MSATVQTLHPVSVDEASLFDALNAQMKFITDSRGDDICAGATLMLATYRESLGRRSAPEEVCAAVVVLRAVIARHYHGVARQAMTELCQSLLHFSPGHDDDDNEETVDDEPAA